MKIKILSETRKRYELTTSNGKNLIIEALHCEYPKKEKNSLMREWLKRKLVKQWLSTTWHIDTYFKNDDCYEEAPNPMVTEDHLINFKWLLEGTQDNLNRLVNETIKLVEKGA